MRIRWSPPAISDLCAIRSYIAEENPAAAEAVAQTLLSAVERLRELPASGRPGRVPDTRELAVPRTPFVIVYTASPTTIDIVTILHAARQWP